MKQSYTDEGRSAILFTTVRRLRTSFPYQTIMRKDRNLATSSGRLSGPSVCQWYDIGGFGFNNQPAKVDRSHDHCFIDVLNVDDGDFLKICVYYLQLLFGMDL